MKPEASAAGYRMKEIPALPRPPANGGKAPLLAGPWEGAEERGCMGSTFTNLVYHIVFSTKNRQNTILPALRKTLYPYIGGIIRGEKGAMLKIGGTLDHVHILASLPPTLSVSEALRRIKGNSSRWVNEGGSLKAHFEWQRGYGAFTVSESMVETVSRYIENQEEHHRVNSFKEEYLLLLQKHGVKYDERYIWD